MKPTKRVKKVTLYDRISDKYPITGTEARLQKIEEHLRFNGWERHTAIDVWKHPESSWNR